MSWLNPLVTCMECGVTHKKKSGFTPPNGMKLPAPYCSLACYEEMELRESGRLYLTPPTQCKCCDVPDTIMPVGQDGYCFSCRSSDSCQAKEGISDQEFDAYRSQLMAQIKAERKAAKVLARSTDDTGPS